jgi:hypothetical protein
VPVARASRPYKGLMLKDMRIASFDSPAEFQQAAGAWLARAPRRNNLILTILRRAVKLAENARCWLVSSDCGPEIAHFSSPIGTTEPVAAGSPPVSGLEEGRSGPLPLSRHRNRTLRSPTEASKQPDGRRGFSLPIYLESSDRRRSPIWMIFGRSPLRQPRI